VILGDAEEQLPRGFESDLGLLWPVDEVPELVDTCPSSDGGDGHDCMVSPGLQARVD